MTGDPGNAAIFEKVQSDHCNNTVNPQRLCLGAASISMNPEREVLMDYLPSYFASGLQLLVQKESSNSAKVMNFVKNLLSLFGGLIAALVALIVVLAPIVFLSETALSGSDNQSIFYATDEQLISARWKTGIITLGSVTKWERFRAGLLGATAWTAALFFGGKVGAPASAPGKTIRLLGKVIFVTCQVVVIAGATALLNGDLNDNTISKFSELGGYKVSPPLIGSAQSHQKSLAHSPLLCFPGLRKRGQWCAN